MADLGQNNGQNEQQKRTNGVKPSASPSGKRTVSLGTNFEVSSAPAVRPTANRPGADPRQNYAAPAGTNGASRPAHAATEQPNGANRPAAPVGARPAYTNTGASASSARAEGTARPVQPNRPASADPSRADAPQQTARPASRRTVAQSNSFEVSGAGKRTRRTGEKRVSSTGRRYTTEAQREELKRKELEENSKLFRYSDRPKNYFINLLIVMFRMALICLLIVCVSGVGFVLGMAKSYLDTVPELDIGLVTDQEQATILYDVNGEFLEHYYGAENREWAALQEIPKELQDAVIAIEDVRFYRHMGIDFKRLFGVAFKNIFSGSTQGGSTLTQQLIKNTVLSFEQTYKRKIQEMSLAIELEKQYSKEQILEAYLNTIYMGGSCYGVKTAAMDYFGKELDQLDLRECACLAGMIQNPSRYNPRTNYYTRNNPARTDNRTNLVLYEMCENGLITREEYEAAKKDTFTVLESSPYKVKQTMIYYTDYVMESLVNEFLEARGLENTADNRSALRKEIRSEGYNIYTTIDAEKQQAAEESVYNFSGYPGMRYGTDTYTVVGRNPDGTVIRLTQPQTAVSVVDYRTGYIVALVGGRQAPTGSMQFNRSFQSTMPVGSSIKPIAVYGPAIENGAGIGTTYYDVQAKIMGWDSEKGYPANNSRTYHGIVSMRTAFGQSLNVPAAEALMYQVGLDQSFDTLVQLGVDPSHINKTGAGLALGTSGITPLEMAGAFTAIANMGTYIEPIAFTMVTDKNGSMVLDMLARQEKRQVFQTSTAWQLTDMMYTVANSVSTKCKVAGQTVYGKTGTNSEMRGVFFAGFTGYYLGTVWIGSDAYKQLVSDAQGGKYAAPLFSAVMTALHKGLPNKPSTTISAEEAGVSKVRYCVQSGDLATSQCTDVRVEYGCATRMRPCSVHQKVQICKESGKIAGQYCPASGIVNASATLIPKDGMLQYLYTNARDIFRTYVGASAKEMGVCDVHSETNQKAGTEDKTQHATPPPVQ